MLLLDSRFRVNEAEIAAKSMDGEAIIINLSNGVYYSMDKAGELIWRLAAEGRTVEQIIQHVVSHYDVNPTQAGEDIQALLAQMVDERLVVPADGAAAASNQVLAEAVGGRLPYVRPQLNIYRDMGDLLALDPPMPSPPQIPWKEPSDRGPKR